MMFTFSRPITIFHKLIIIIMILILIITDEKKLTAGLNSLTNYTVKRHIKSVGKICIKYNKVISLRLKASVSVLTRTNIQW